MLGALRHAWHGGLTGRTPRHHVGLLLGSRVAVRQGLRQSRTTSSVSSGVPYEAYAADQSTLKDAAPEQADVVIMGGGVIGCSTLYHLSKMGVSNVVLVEKDQLTAGTTWHTAGLVWGLRPSDLEVELLKTSKDLMQRLESETGIHSGWINNGGIFVASTKERLDEYKRLMTLGKPFGIDSHVLSADETLKVYPLMNVKDVYGTLYVPSDGTIDPAGYCSALTRAAQRNGARVLQDCPVTGIQVDTDDYGTKKVRAVETSRGTIRTPTVVNCAGVWAPHLGQLAGVSVPLVAMHHAYVVTERIEGIQNMPNVRDHDASVYLKLQGDALCIGGYEPNPIFCKEVPQEFAFSLYDLDWDAFGANIEGCLNRVPAIEKSGIKSTVCGPESFTADHKPLMGESPEVRGYFLGCGFNSSGMMLSGGCGEQLAQWIVDGCPQHDMFGYDIRRFPTQLTSNETWTRERSHEAYAKNYSIVFPYDEPLASRNMRKDALYEVLRDAGCVFQERQGWERPGWFSKEGPAPVLPYDYYGYYGIEKHPNNVYFDRLKMDYTFEFPKQHDTIKEECLGCRQRVALFNMSYFGKFYITGPEAQEAVNWIFSNDLDKPAGKTVYTCMLNSRGGVEADLTVSMIEPGTGQSHQPSFEGVGFYVAVGGGLGQHAYSHMLNILQDQKYDCKITDHSEDLVMMSLQGPKSRDVLESLTDANLSNDAFSFSTNKIIQVAGHSARAIRLTFVGELGWELHVPNQSAVPIYKALMDAGKKHGIANAGYRAIDSLSLEKGYRHWHEDMRGDDSPLEAALAFTCKLKSDTDFLGRQALEKQKKDGLRRRIACFTIDEHLPLHGLEAIWRNDQVVGFIRRADYAFHVDKSMAYGYLSHPDGDVVSKDYLTSGNYSLESMGQMIPATLHMKSPFDPKNLRLKGIYD